MLQENLTGCPYHFSLTYKKTIKSINFTYERPKKDFLGKDDHNAYPNSNTLESEVEKYYIKLNREIINLGHEAKRGTVSFSLY